MSAKIGYLGGYLLLAGCSAPGSPAGSSGGVAPVVVAGGTGGGFVQTGGAASGGTAQAGTATMGGAGAGGGGTGGAGGVTAAGTAGVMNTGGGSGAAGAAGASGAAGATGCTGVLCEDFELGSIDPAKWDLTQGNGGTAVVQTDVVAHGKYALKVHGLAGAKDDYAQIVTKSGPEALKGAHYGRANFYITPKPLTSGHTSMVFAGVNGTGAANGPGPFTKLRYLEVSNINGGWQFGFDLLDIAPLIEEVYYPAGSPRVPTTAWTCLEWQFTDQPDTASVWVDGTSIGTFDDQHVSYPSGHASGTPLYNGSSSGLIGSFNLFGFGFHDWHPNQPFDLYYDDIVLDTKRVGCAK